MRHAQRELRETGSVTPRVIVEAADGDKQMLLLSVMPATHEARAAMMLLIGYHVAGGGVEREGIIWRPFQPVLVGSVVEAWVSQPRPNAPRPLPMPSEDPDRREALVGVTMTAPPDPVYDLLMLPFTRDHRDRIRFDRPNPEFGDVEPEAPLLESFWDGVALAPSAGDADVQRIVSLAQFLAGGMFRMVDLDSLGDS